MFSRAGGAKNVMLKQSETNRRLVKSQFTAQARRTRRLRGEEERGEKSLLTFSLRSLSVLRASAVNSALHFLRYRRVRKLLSLSFNEKLIFVEAVVMLPFVRAALRLFGLRRSQQFLSMAANGRNVDWTGVEVERLSYLVNAAANNGLLRANCLERSLLLWRLLRRSGFAGDIRIGVLKKAEQFRAHAWVELNGVVLNDRPDIGAEFAPFPEATAETR